MMAESFRQRLQIPIDPKYVTIDGKEYMEHYPEKLYTKTGLLVAYADYRVHKCYISPFDLYLSGKRLVII